MARITQKQASQPDAGGFDINPNENFGDLPEGMEDQAEVAAVEPRSEKYEYKPSPKTLEKLNAMPKEDLFKEFGISLDDRVTENPTTRESASTRASSARRVNTASSRTWPKAGTPASRSA